MTLQEKIEAGIKEAMKARDKDRLRTLRSLKSAILLELTSGNAGGLSAEKETDILVKQAKQRKESAEQFRANGRADLAEPEEVEYNVIKEFLPSELSPEELKSEIESIISEMGASGMKDMGKVMGIANQKLVGKADGRAISTLVKAILTS